MLLREQSFLLLDKNVKFCYTYDNLSRVTKRETKSLDNAIISEETFTYDAAGNITDAPESCFAYDNGLEIKFDMKMEDLVMCFGISVIGVLRMVSITTRALTHH